MWRSGAVQRRGARGTRFGCRCAYALLWDVASMSVIESAFVPLGNTRLSRPTDHSTAATVFLRGSQHEPRPGPRGRLWRLDRLISDRPNRLEGLPINSRIEGGHICISNIAIGSIEEVLNRSDSALSAVSPSKQDGGGH